MKQKNSIISITLATLLFVSLCAVCASTSVSANPIPAGTGPALIIPKGSDYMYLFVKGYDGALWYNRENLVDPSLPNWGWSGWQSLGGQLTSSPSAVSREAGMIDVYVRGTNGAVYVKAYYSGAWHGWANLGGQVAANTGPAASGWTDREDVFVEGTNGALYQKTLIEGSGWTNWAHRGGQLTSSPGAVSRQSGMIDVYVRGTNGAVYQKAYYSGAWHGWASLGGVLKSGTGPSPCVWQEFPNRKEVFITGTDGAMYQKTWTAESGWTKTWASVGGQLTSSPGVASPTGPLRYAIEIFARGTDGLLHLNEYAGGQWRGWTGNGQGPP